MVDKVNIEQNIKVFPKRIHDFKYSNLSELAENGPLASQSQRGIFRMFTFSRHLTSNIRQIKSSILSDVTNVDFSVNPTHTATNFVNFKLKSAAVEVSSS